MDRQSQPGDAQGGIRAYPPDLHGDVRRADAPGRWRGQGCVPRACACGAARAGAEKSHCRKGRRMSPTQFDMMILVLGVCGILLVASFVGHVLERRLSPDGTNAAIENLNARINAWWVMAILIAIAFVAGPIGVLLLFAFCSFAA